MHHSLKKKRSDTCFIHLLCEGCSGLTVDDRTFSYIFEFCHSDWCKLTRLMAHGMVTQGVVVALESGNSQVQYWHVDAVSVVHNE